MPSSSLKQKPDGTDPMNPSPSCSGVHTYHTLPARAGQSVCSPLSRVAANTVPVMAVPSSARTSASAKSSLGGAADTMWTVTLVTSVVSSNGPTAWPSWPASGTTPKDGW